MRIIRSDYPIDGLRRCASCTYPKRRHVDTICAPAHVRCFRHAWSKDIGMLLEIGIVVLSIVAFVILYLYVLGCERV
jgi:hypothetical protein